VISHVHIGGGFEEQHLFGVIIGIYAIPYAQGKRTRKASTCIHARLRAFNHHPM
jgi:hypothetical protein